MKRVPLCLPAIALGITLKQLGVQPGLLGERVRDRRGVEQHPQQRMEQLAKETKEAVRRVIEAGFVERIRLRRPGCRGVSRGRSLAGGATELVEQLRLESTRVENRLEPPRGQL